MEVKCTPYSTSLNCIIKKIYEPADDVMFSYIIPTLFIITMVSYIINLYIKTQILEGKQDWATNMCIPKYMFISGLINTKTGENPLLATSANFQQCVKEFKKLKFYEKDPTIIKSEYEKIMQAFGLTLPEISKTNYEMAEYVSDFLKKVRISEEDFENATVEDIKRIITSQGIY